MEFELLIKYFEGRATPEEAMAIDDWRDASAETREYFDQLYGSWQEGHDHPFTVVKGETAWLQMTQKTTSTTIQIPKKSKRLRLWWAAAASVLLLIGLCIWKLNVNNTTEKQLISQTATGTGQMITLPDSSTVKLFAGSTIRYLNEKDNRIIHFSGSGSFHIRHDEQHPWSIHLDSIVIKDIGTIFEIQQKTDSTIVAVSEGAVELSTANDKLVLSAGQSGGFLRHSHKFFVAHQALRSNFRFEDATLSEVAGILENKYGVQIIFKDEQLKSMRLTASLEDQTLTDVLGVLTSTFGIDHELINSKVYLTRQGNSE